MAALFRAKRRMTLLFVVSGNWPKYSGPSLSLSVQFHVGSGLPSTSVSFGIDSKAYAKAAR